MTPQIPEVIFFNSNSGTVSQTVTLNSAQYYTLSQVGCVHSTCHAPDPGPTRLGDPNRSPGRDTIYTIYILCCIGTLIDLFFLKAVPVPVSIQTISVITKIIYIYQKNYHRSSVHKSLYTYTESHILYMYNFYYKTSEIAEAALVSTYL